LQQHLWAILKLDASMAHGVGEHGSVNSQSSFFKEELLLILPVHLLLQLSFEVSR